MWALSWAQIDFHELIKKREKGVGGKPWILPKSYLDPKYSSKVTQKSISKLSKWQTIKEH